MPYATLPTQFTLLHGDFQLCHNLLEELVERRLEPGTVIALDFEGPIICSASSLFYDNNPMKYNFHDNKVRKENIPISPPYISLESWIAHEKGFLRDKLGNDILGRMMAKYYHENGFENVCPYVISRDLDSQDDIIPLLKAGYTVSIIDLGSFAFRQPIPNVRYYPIPVPTPASKAADYLIRELENERQVKHRRVV